MKKFIQTLVFISVLFCITSCSSWSCHNYYGRVNPTKKHIQKQFEAKQHQYCMVNNQILIFE